MPESKFALTFERHPIPYLAFCYRPKVGKRGDAKLWKNSDRSGDEDHYHPRCSEISEARYLVEAEHGNQRGDCPYNKHCNNPSYAIGIDVVKCRHWKIEWYSYRGSADSDHRSSKKTKQSCVNEVVPKREVLPSYFLKLIVEGHTLFY